MRYVLEAMEGICSALELRALQAVNDGGREGCVAGAVGVVMLCAILYAGNRPWKVCDYEGCWMLEGGAVCGSLLVLDAVEVGFGLLETLR